MAGSGRQIPAIISTGLICLALGGAGAVVVMTYMGYERRNDERVEDIMAEAMAKKGSSDPKSMYSGGGGPPGGKTGPGGGKMAGGAKGGGGRTGGFGPSPKSQLAQLVSKLDVLTSKPLSIQLSDDQRTKVREQLKGLASEEELADEEALKRLNALIVVLQEHKATLVEAGFFWPGEGGFAFGAGAAANPFKDGRDAEHLKSLDQRLGKDK